jgi:uracil-DNA glycosylase family 4
MLFDLPDTKIDRSEPPPSVLKIGCRVCTLDREEKNLFHPKMPATGAEHPIIYIIGEANGKNEDKQGKQFVGEPGALLRTHIPSKYLPLIRWNNAVNCRPPENRNPTKLEIDCCRSRIVEDIERSKPKAIFGFGLIPLNWTGRNNIGNWRGRKFPIQVGNHTCWYFAFLHPSALLHYRTANKGRPSTQEFAFEMDIKNALKTVSEGLPEPLVHTEKNAKANIEWITGHDPDDLNIVHQYLEQAETEGCAGIDYETQGLRPYGPEALLLSAAVAVARGVLAFPIDHPQAGWSEENKEKLKERWKQFLLSDCHKIVHNASFEQEWSAYFYGNEVLYKGEWQDTLTQAYILDERSDSKHMDGPLSLAFLTHQYFGLNIKTISTKMNKDNMASEPLPKLLPYNALDAKYHRLLYFEQVVIEKEGLEDAYYEKLRQIPTCVATQLKGIPVDFIAHEEVKHDFINRINQLEREIFSLPEVKEFKQLMGEVFNPGSDKNVLILLRDIIKTNEGQEGNKWGTDKHVLEKINHPFGKLQIAWRNATKMKSTYIDRFSPQNITADKLFHPILGTCFTDTGRLNSDLQNLPKRDESSKVVRRQLGKRINGTPTGVFASLDYGQIEARLIATSSRDKSYCTMIWDGYEVHGYWAERIARRYPQCIGGEKFLTDKRVMKKLRDKTKNKWTFPLFFTASLESVSAYMEIPVDALRSEYEEFWRVFEGVKQWQDDVIRKYKEVGYVECLNGRRRRAPMKTGEAINSPIQGSACDLIMDADNRLSRMAYQQNNPNYQSILQIHDDLTFWFENEKALEDHIETIIKEMLNIRFDWLVVPLTVELSIGPNLCDMEEVQTFSSDKWLNWPVRLPEFM